MAFDREDAIFRVVVNAEDQYSIWPIFKDVPDGWTSVDVKGPKADCLAYIEEAWTDMRPLSLRMQMEEDVKAADSPHRG
jgi:MbtH protein